MKLSAEQKRFWIDNGYLAVENVIPREIIDAEKQRFDWLCEHWNSPEAQKLHPMAAARCQGYELGLVHRVSAP